MIPGVEHNQTVLLGTDPDSDDLFLARANRGEALLNGLAARIDPRLRRLFDVPMGKILDELVAVAREREHFARFHLQHESSRARRATIDTKAKHSIYEFEFVRMSGQ